MNNKLIIIAAGGTGGHVFPGIALGYELKRKNYNVRFITRKNDLFIPLLNKHSFDYSTINIHGWNRRLSFRIFSSFALCIASFFKSLQILTNCKPSAVVGMGGYVSLPVVVAAWFKNIPVLIHEQNIVPGLTNSISSCFAKKIAISFDESKSKFKSNKIIVTGNPVRNDLLGDEPKNAQKNLHIPSNKLVVLIFGGSQGASSINAHMLSAINIIERTSTDKPFFIHITGKKDYAKVLQAYTSKQIPALVKDFTNDMGILYSAADLVICRAGASTIAELIYMQKPAILVPYPHAAGDHQKKNAEYLFNKGCVHMAADKELSGLFLSNTILDYMHNKDHLSSMKNNYHLLANITANAHTNLANAVESII
ncbi:MAG: undecaprenyldiphospho-muramoylpentapeptide beta-N-acetylglucosaminyltransferase [bacterium]